MSVHTSEILFIKSVKCGIPNRDPLRESDARRLFGEDDGRISLSDVSIKRDVRDYILDRFPDGGPDRDRFVFVRKEYSPDGQTLLGRDGLLTTLLQRAGEGKTPPAATPPTSTRKKGKGAEREEVLAAAFDMRVFGAVYSVAKKSFSLTGPVQFGWAHSLHPVETRYTQGTVCMPSKDAPAPGADAEDKGKTQGTIWTQYQLPFAVFAMPAVVSAPLAAKSCMTAGDVDQLLAGLWRGTLARQAGGRGIQQPLFLLHVEYKDPFFRLGFLDEGVKLDPGCDEAGRARWLGGRAPTEVRDVTLDVTALAAQLQQASSQLARVRLWTHPALRLAGALEAEPGVWPEGV